MLVCGSIKRIKISWMIQSLIDAETLLFGCFICRLMVMPSKPNWMNCFDIQLVLRVPYSLSAMLLIDGAS